MILQIPTALRCKWAKLNRTEQHTMHTARRVYINTQRSHYEYCLVDNRSLFSTIPRFRSFTSLRMKKK